MNAIEYLQDCETLQAVFLNFHIEATLSECQSFWSWRSDLYSASWLCYINDSARVIEDVKEFLPQYWDEFPDLEPKGNFNPRYYLEFGSPKTT